MVTSKLKVLLFGMNGTGLSTIANMLVSGEPQPSPPFKRGDGMQRDAYTVASYEGRGYHVVTVGIVDETEALCSDAIDLIKSRKETQDVEYSHILFVKPESWYDNLGDDIWNLFLKIFEGAEPSFGLIVTECKDLTKCQQESERLLQERYGKFILPGRYIFFDCLSMFENGGLNPCVRSRWMIEECLRLDASLWNPFVRNNFKSFKPNYDSAKARGSSTQPDSAPKEMGPIDQAFPSKPIRKVMLFGKTGQGKSTLANMLVTGELLHDPLCKMSDGMSGTTRIVASHEGRGYHVVDTVGIGEGTESNRKHAKDHVYEFLKETQGEYSHILLVISAGRFDQLDKDISKIFPKIFEGAEPAFGVVVTNCSDPERWQQENEVLLQEKYGGFILPGRYMYADFPALDKDVEMEALLRKKRTKSLESLDSALLEFFHGNDFQYFKPTYATATDSYLRSFAKELWLALFNFVKFKIFRCRQL